MERKDLNTKQVKDLLEVIAGKLKKNPADLYSEFESGKFDNAIKNMNKKEEAMFNKALKHPKMVQTFLSNTQAQELYKNLLGN